jgi:hypothetical protein
MLDHVISYPNPKTRYCLAIENEILPNPTLLDRKRKMAIISFSLISSPVFQWIRRDSLHGPILTIFFFFVPFSIREIEMVLSKHSQV